MSQTSTSLIATPQKAVSVLKKPVSTQQSTETFPPSPGTFRHPRLAEIVARQSATTFTSRNLQDVFVNSSVLVLTLLFNGPIHSILDPLISSANLPTYIFSTGPIINSLRLVLLVNVLLSLRPAIPYLSKKDELTDIPLTPSQRVLFGLNPSIPSTPTSGAPGQPINYVTPPRYRRTSGTGTPNSSTFTGRRSISANYSGSPLSTSRATVGFSPSPQSQSPSTFNRHSSSSIAAIASNDFDQSYNANRSISNFAASTNTSTLGRSQSLRERDGRRGSAPFESIGPGTPSPSSRRTAATAGINYKWLYDKGSRLPKSESMGF